MKFNLNGRQASAPEEMEDWVCRYRASGMGLQHFAREHGLAATRLHYWVYGRGRTRAVRTNSGAPLFQEVKLPEGLPLPASWAAEISLPEGVAVRFSAGAAPVWIGAVVQALRRPC